MAPRCCRSGQGAHADALNRDSCFRHPHAGTASLQWQTLADRPRPSPSFHTHRFPRSSWVSQQWTACPSRVASTPHVRQRRPSGRDWGLLSAHNAPGEIALGMERLRHTQWPGQGPSRKYGGKKRTAARATRRQQNAMTGSVLSQGDSRIACAIAITVPVCQYATASHLPTGLRLQL